MRRLVLLVLVLAGAPAATAGSDPPGDQSWSSTFGTGERCTDSRTDIVRLDVVHAGEGVLTLRLGLAASEGTVTCQAPFSSPFSTGAALRGPGLVAVHLDAPSGDVRRFSMLMDPDSRAMRIVYGFSSGDVSIESGSWDAASATATWRLPLAGVVEGKAYEVPRENNRVSAFTSRDVGVDIDRAAGRPSSLAPVPYGLGAYLGRATDVADHGAWGY